MGGPPRKKVGGCFENPLNTGNPQAPGYGILKIGKILPRVILGNKFPNI